MELAGVGSRRGPRVAETRSSAIWLLIFYLQSATAFMCNFDAFNRIQPKVYEEGAIVSVNYPNGYSSFGGVCRVDIELCLGCRLQLIVREDSSADGCPHLDGRTVERSEAEETRLTGEHCSRHPSCQFFKIWSADSPPRLFNKLPAELAQFRSNLSLVFCYGNSSRRTPDARRRRWKIAFRVYDVYTFRCEGSVQSFVCGSRRNRIVSSLRELPESAGEYTYLFHARRPEERICFSFIYLLLREGAASLQIEDKSPESFPESSPESSHELSHLNSTGNSSHSHLAFCSRSHLLVLRFRSSQPDAISFLFQFHFVSRYIEFDSANCPEFMQMSSRQSPQYGHMAINMTGSQTLDCVWRLETADNQSLELQLQSIPADESLPPDSFSLSIRDITEVQQFPNFFYAPNVATSWSSLSSDAGFFVHLRAVNVTLPLILLDYYTHSRDRWPEFTQLRPSGGVRSAVIVYPLIGVAVAVVLTFFGCNYHRRKATEYRARLDREVNSLCNNLYQTSSINDVDTTVELASMGEPSPTPPPEYDVVMNDAGAGAWRDTGATPLDELSPLEEQIEGPPDYETALLYDKRLIVCGSRISGQLDNSRLNKRRGGDL